MEKCISCAGELPVEFCLRKGECVTLDDLPEAEVYGLDSSGEDAAEKEMRDPISTGRKRAARMYKIPPGATCEWAYRKNAGGGIKPIVGCPGRPAVHIHHGPDKSTLNNERNNISLICNFCHNRWHTENDRFYKEPRPADNSAWLPELHDSDLVIHTLDEMVKATKNEVLINEMQFPEGGKDKK